MASQTFEQMMVALQGVTVLEKPKVSRETLVTVAKDHTTLIKECKEEIKFVGSMIERISNESAENKRAVKVLDEIVKTSREDIDSLSASVVQIRSDIESINNQLTELWLLKEIVQQQGEAAAELKHKFESHTSNMVVYINKTTHAVAALDAKNNETQSQLRELKDYVDHFGDNIVLASSQITVESSAGFSERPISLLEILTRCNSNLGTMDKTLENHEERIASHAATLLTKADDSVLFDIDNLNVKVKAIETHLKREEEQGISAIRKQCDNLSEQVDSVQFQLADKVGREDVDSIVHRKYEDIVQYLQEALRSNEEEEQNSAKRAAELHELVQKLNIAKADRSEIVPMQELLVRAESMMSKISGPNKDKDKGSKDGYSKKEIEALLELKVDKTDYEEQMKSFSKAQKKNRKLSSLHGSGGFGGVPEEPGAAVWRTMSDAMKQESKEALSKVAENAIISASGEKLQLEGEALLDAAPVSASPAAASSGIAELEQTLADAKVVGSMKDFSMFVKSKARNLPVTSSSLPGNANPGAFRSATEGGRAGGDNRPPSPGIAAIAIRNSSENPDGSSAVEHPIESSDAKPGHDLSFLGGPFVGGGFNLRQNHLKTHALKPMNVSSSEAGDIEGTPGRMLRGNDGKYYFTDKEAFPGGENANNNQIGSTKSASSASRPRGVANRPKSTNAALQRGKGVAGGETVQSRTTGLTDDIE